ncbi:DUF3343 domain-containing protein [Paludicola sp. MB14-C6]|uniref:DUF3343 domain-containing protein n=1 Tax=Paludihabitans sp. MB14-C6 TaxID=3070656 RepID=UPI0027DB017C|nr:DUF3343 domain-containing protein [Paludicola sp. MB14-C6]WMJ23374.1 DUF3343 domain-containing protein [Paludicola sp. MB14-C6]
MVVMDKQLIMVNSITYAYKARDILYNNGIKAYIERIPSNLRKNGCGYGIRINENAYRAVQVLELNGIRVKDVIDLP